MSSFTGQHHKCSVVMLQHTSVSPDSRTVIVVGDNPDGLLSDSQTGKVNILFSSSLWGFLFAIDAHAQQSNGGKHVTSILLEHVLVTTPSYITNTQGKPGVLWSTKGGLVTNVHGELKSYGPNQNLYQLIDRDSVEIVGDCNFEGPLRLFICISMASRWSIFCDREPRYDLPPMGYSKSGVLTSSSKGAHWCYSLPPLHFWWAFHGYGWACRLCACVWHQAGLCKVSRNWSLWWSGRHFFQPWFWSSVCGSCGPHLWQPSWV